MVVDHTSNSSTNCPQFARRSPYSAKRGSVIQSSRPAAAARFWKLRSLATAGITQPSALATGPNIGRPGGGTGNCAACTSPSVSVSIDSSMETSTICPRPVTWR